MDHLNTNIKWGIYLGLAVSAATQILTCMGLGLTNWFVFATYALVILCLILIFRILKKQNQGKLKFSTAIISTIIIVLVGRIIFQGYMWAYTNFVEPNWVNDVAEIWTNMLEESITPAEKIEEQIQSFKKSYETIPMFTIELVKYAIPQFVLGIITSLFFVFRKSKSGN